MVFHDDSVEVQFKDGSSIQLSPCGSCYQYVRNVADSFVVSESNVEKRRCCFATSETKSKVNFCIFWRNHFAQRPYLPNYLLCMYNNKVHLHKDITSYTWPDDADIKGIKNDKSETDKSDVVIHAKEDFAILTVSKNGYMCKVEYFVKVSPLSTPVMYNEKKKNIIEKRSKRNYVCLKKIFCSSSCPTFCKFPLSIVLGKIKQNNDMVDVEENQLSQLINSSHAPQPLPSVCNKQFSHVWKLSQKTQDSGLFLPTNSFEKTSKSCLRLLKTVWNSGVLYWVVKSSAQNTVRLEAWVSDGTVIVSNTSSNYYFTHFTSDAQNKVKFNMKRLYSPTCLPMNSNLKSAILRAIRLRSYAEQALADCPEIATVKHCWQENILGFGNLEIESDFPAANNLDYLHETVNIPKLGKFSVINSSVRIIFENGTTIYITINQSNLNSLQISNETLSAIPCRILFSNGQFMECNSLIQPDFHLSGYLNAACDWLLWLARPKAERQKNSFYSDTIFSSEKLAMVISELEKINRFNNLIESNSLESNTSNELSTDNKKLSLSNKSSETLDRSSTSPRLYKKATSSYNKSAPWNVDDVLKSTSDAINDIDSLISRLRQSKS